MDRDGFWQRHRSAASPIRRGAAGTVAGWTCGKVSAREDLGRCGKVCGQSALSQMASAEQAKQDENRRGRPKPAFKFAEITYWWAVGASGAVLVKGGAMG